MRKLWPICGISNPGGRTVRSVRLTGEHRIEGRIEMTNVTNKTNFGNPTGSLQSGDFMRIFTLYNAYAERQVRLAIRYSF